MSSSNSMALLERTSLNVYGADIFNCSRHLQSLASEHLARNLNSMADNSRDASAAIAERSHNNIEVFDSLAPARVR